MASAGLSVQTSVAPLWSDPRTDAVVDIIERLSFAPDLQAVLDVVRTSVRRLIGADGVTFVLRDGDFCHYADEDAISPLWKGQRFPMRTCISGWAMLNRQTAVIEDIYQDPRIPHDAYRLTFVKSLMMVPVRPDDPIAAIGAYWAERHAASAEEIAILQTIARSTALALTNVQLVDSLRSALERTEAQAAELARANTAKTRFLASASHDLRQPVQSILLLASAVRPHVGESGQPHFRHLEQSLDVLKGLLDNLLDVSKIDAGLVTPDIRDVSLSQVFEWIDAAFRRAAEGKGLEWHVVPTSALVRTDPVLLTRILHNLAENAIRYTGEGRILIDSRRKNGRIRIDIHDTGQGIPSEFLEEIYAEFFQLGNPERDRSQGLGLGLTIVKKLADLLGHTIHVTSTVGDGSVFSIEIPESTIRSQPTQPPRPDAMDGGGRLMVLVEDDAIVRLALKAMLETWRFAVLAVESGEEAVEWLRTSAATPPAFVLADYRLRDNHLGTDAVRAIESWAGQRIPAVILTGEIGDACDRDAQTSGYPVLRKPIMPGQLQTAILQRIAEATLAGMP